MTAKNKPGFSISEHPIANNKDDCFDVEPRIVNKIFNIIDDKSTGRITIAITGEWGVGKSSVINLLRNKLVVSKKNIVINFEPLAEGKLEISQIIELFYLKLYSGLSGSGVKDVLKKCLKNIAILTRAKLTGNLELDTGALGVPAVKAGVRGEYNWSDNVDALLDLWEKEKPKDFSDQTRELNEALLKNEYRLHIFIDEVDRLPANYIINFLLFCRILESFDSMVCVVGIDYEQVINKLKKESSLCLDDYERAQGYLDKLFQIKRHVHHNRYKKINFTISRLRDLDGDHIFDEIIESNNYDVRSKLEDIIDYLSTPRQIKKWLISLKINYSIIKYSRAHKLSVMAFLAATIKHPILIDYLAKNALRLLGERLRLRFLIKDNYGVDFTHIEERDLEIIAASMGVRMPGKRNDEAFQNLADAFSKKLKVQIIDDLQAGRYLMEYFETSEYLIALFVEGFMNEDQVSLYDKFFSNEIDAALTVLAIDDVNTDILASDLADALRKRALRLIGVPKLALLNDLWSVRVDENDFINPYETIIMFSLQRLPLEDIINQCLIGLSETDIASVLYSCGINNKKGAYDFADFIVPADDVLSKRGMHDLRFNGTPIKSFSQATISQIVKLWLDQVEKDLRSKDVKVYNQKKLISVFYRYIQWSGALGHDNRKNLADYVVGYFQDADISASEKEYLKMIIKNEKEKFDSKKWGIEDCPVDGLFGADMKVMKFVL